MSLYRRLAFPLLKLMDPERAHESAAWLLQRAQASAPGEAMLRRIAGRIPLSPVRLWGLEFPNPLGVAAGFDKDVRIAAGLAALGFGHIEVGTLTPRPQAGNPRPRIFRLPRHESIVNRMGFPNGGVQAALPRLKALCSRPRNFVLGVSLGKQKETPLADAGSDYIEVMRAVYPCADYLAINISSPNTPGLRELQTTAYLSNLLHALASERSALADKHRLRPRPLLVKIAPDLTDADLDGILEAAAGAGIDGIIATNTTLSRAGVEDDPRAAETGGLSGPPLADPSTRLIARIVRVTGGKLPIIGAGGIDSASQARRKLDAGASLLQLYTGLVYQGPGIAGQILRGLEG